MRNKKVPLKTVNRYPTDWLDLKGIFAEVMKKVYMDYGETQVRISLERHLPGKWFVKFAPKGYSQRRFRYRRDYEGMFKVAFNPKSHTVQVVQASFAPSLMYLASDYWQMERDIRWRSPPLIPRQHQNILQNPKLILMEPSGMRYADYSKPSRQGYSTNEQPARYSSLHKGLYAYFSSVKQNE